MLNLNQNHTAGDSRYSPTQIFYLLVSYMSCELTKKTGLSARNTLGW